MAARTMRICFASHISELTQRNSSFDAGVLRVAYTGRNRNNSFISKESFERSIPTIYNCPVVCRYDRETDTIGSHDMDLVKDDDGAMRLVNATDPVGVVPEGARWWWEEVEDVSGIHEYLCVEVLLWKRQEAYRKIKEDGVTDESMEITVKRGQMKDGVYVIEDFEFTAFCLLGTAEPCYESASLSVFSKGEFEKQWSDMMREFKETFSVVKPIEEDPGAAEHLEGGECVKEKEALMAEFGLSAEQLDFKLEDFSLDELRVKFEQLKNAGSKEAAEKEAGGKEQFELEGQRMNELTDALESETIETEFGNMPRYWYMDCDWDAMEVYAWDSGDKFNLYGMKFRLDGDRVVVDFQSRKRKKCAVVDFDEGEQGNAAGKLFALAENKLREEKEAWEEKFQKAQDDAQAVSQELETLRKFKADADAVAEKVKRDEVLSRFEDLSGVEAFEALRSGSSDLSLDALEEKCFAIRGRQGCALKFANQGKAPKLPVEPRGGAADEPYGGVFEEFGMASGA